MRLARRSFPGYAVYQLFVSALTLAALTLAASLGIGLLVPSAAATHVASNGSASAR